MAIYTWTAPSNGQLYKSDLSTTIQPGDTIILSGNFQSILMKKINGTAENPVNIIVNTPVNVTGNGNYGMIITGNHWVLQGNNNLTVAGSTLLNQLFGFEDSSNFIIDGVTLTNGKVGFFGNATTVPGIRENITIRNSTIYNISTGQAEGLGTAEAIYLGNTSISALSPTYWRNVVIENINAYDLDGDGIQIAATQNAIIRNCTITNHARKNIPSQKFGILVGGCSQALVENCTVTNGRGGALHIYGVNKTIVRNCNFTGNATGASTDDAVYIEKKCSGESALILSVEFDNVIINGATRNGVRNVNAVDVLLKDVTISNTLSSPTSGTNFRIETTPPPVFSVSGVTDLTYAQFTILNNSEIFTFTNAGFGITSVVNNLPAGMTLTYDNGNSGAFYLSGTPLNIGSYPIYITINTSNGNETVSLLLEVVAVPSVERVPIFVIYDNGTWEGSGPIKTLFTNIS